MQNQLSDRISTILYRLVYFPGDDEETILLKKIWWTFVASCVLFPGIEVVTAWIIGEMEVAALSGIIVALCLLLLLVFHFHRRHIERFGLAFQLFIVAVTSVKTLLTGGLVYTAGVVYVGLIGPIQAIIFPNKKRAVAIFLLYCIAVVGGTLAQPFLWPDYKNPGAYFILTYITKFIFGTFFVFFALQYFTSKLQKMKKEEAKRLKDLDDLKTKFYTDITHEFRTPLSVILGMADQIIQSPSEWLDEGASLIKTNGERLLALINQMLDLSKLEAGAMSLTQVHDDMVAYTRYLCESFHSLAQKKGIELRFNSENEAFYMDFDPEKIRNIFTNLMSNAVKFTPEGGTITIGQGFSIENGLKRWIMTVEDTGIGIPEHYLERVFDRYFQVENHATPATSGTGLGLALAREMARLMGGEIQASGKKSHGAIFTLKLPVTHLAPEQKATTLGLRPVALPELLSASIPLEQAPSTAIKHPLQLLIVEDNPDVVRYLEAVLSPYHQLMIAEDGVAGWAIACEQAPDLVISDVMMPEMDGFELCSRLKTDLRTSHIPVILLTARADLASRLEGLEHGADVYLAKPFDREELLVHVRKLIELRQMLQQRYKTIGLLENNVEKDQDHPKEHAFLQQVRDTLKEHLTEEDFGIEALCRQMRMSRSQLYRKFQALTDTTVHQFLQEIRLHQAREMLIHSDERVSEVAYLVGFKNLSHFSRAFSDLWGVSPGKIRKRNGVWDD